MRVSMLLSVALNLFFLATIVAARVDQSRPSNSANLEPLLIQPADRVGSRRGGLAEINTALLEAGIDAADIGSALLGWLLVENSSRQSYAGGSQYWQQGFAPGEVALREKMSRENAVREALIEWYGPAARNEAAFDLVFRPLDPALWFLSSTEQLSLEHYQFEQVRAASVRPRTEDSQFMSCSRVPIDSLNSQPVNSLTDLEARIGEQAFEEYMLRFSPLSARLRESGIAADEAGFRRLFGLLRELEQQSSPASQVAIRARLREAMGDAEFARFWSSQDPAFEPLAEYLRQQAFTEEQVQAAYAVVNRTQDALLELMSRQPSQQNMLSTVNRLKQDETLRLTQLLGERAAAGLAAATTRYAMRMATEKPLCSNGFKEEDQ